TVLANAFNHRDGPAIANGKTLPCLPRHVQLARSSPVQNGIAHKHVAAFCGVVSRADHYGSAGKSLAHIVVGLAGQLKRMPRAQERSETLPRGSRKFPVEGA